MAWMRFQISQHIKTAGMPVSVDVLFPEHRKNNCEKVKTLYLLHGYHGDRTDWLLKTNLLRKVEEYPIAVVLPDGLNSFYVNLPSTHYFSDYLCQELPQYLESILPLSDQREDKYIAGLSMGGYGAFRQALNHPEVFGAAASFSGVMDIRAMYQMHMTTTPVSHIFGPEDKLGESGNDLFAAARRLSEEKVDVPKLMQLCGTEDPLLEPNRKFAQALKELNIPVMYEESPGAHDWDYWEQCLDKLLNFLEIGKEVTL